MSRAVAPPPVDPAWSDPHARPGSDHLVPVRPLDGVLLVVWSLLGQAIVVVAVGFAGVTSLAGVSGVAVVLLAQSVVLAGVAAWLAGRGRLSWRLLGSVAPTAGHVARGIGVGLAGVLLTSGIILLASLLTDVEPADQALLRESLAGGPVLLLSAAAAVVLAPLIEELVFRGILFQSVGRAIAGDDPDRDRVPWAAAAVSGAAFAVVHLEVAQAPYMLALWALGTLFAVSFHRTRSLLVPVVAHATFNATQLSLALVTAT